VNKVDHDEVHMKNWGSDGAGKKGER
jgi:hypothetical protein